LVNLAERRIKIGFAVMDKKVKNLCLETLLVSLQSNEKDPFAIKTIPRI